MDLSKCRTCVNYDSFFGSCDLYVRDVYLDEGDWEVHPVSIRSVRRLECEYEPMKGENNDR